MTFLSKKSIFSVENGRKFKYALNKAGRDNNASMMFLDNLDPRIRTNILLEKIEKGLFKAVILSAFKWDKSNEGTKFWLEVERNIKDLE